ncbi:MAG: hypothetical protein IPL61_05575 [Myxococcales bacterium]|nr:hypothetical protein [Myxococcales bacterium]
MIERVVAWLARGFVAVVALACAVGLALGARGLIGDAVGPALRGGRGLAVALAVIAGAVAAARGWSPARVLAWPPRRWFVGAAVIVALGTGVWAHHAIARGVPDVPDELGYLHTARTFAHGELIAPSPPATEFFYVSWGVHDHDQWYAVFPPGYGALLAVGEVAGAPGWINPILGAALVLVLFLLAEDLLGRDGVGARVVVLLYLASWFRLMNAASFMAHPTAALAAALAVLGLMRGVAGATEHRARWAGAGGAALAFLGATRQLDAVVIAAALVPVLGLALARGRVVAARRLALAIACALPIAGAYLLYNRALTGDAFLPPQQRYMQLKERRGDCFRIGFGPGVGECPITQGTSFGPKGFAPKHAVANSKKRLDAWVRYSFGWTPLALLPVLGLLGAAVRGGARARGLALVGGVFVATVVGYGLFFYHGVIYGARFYYLAWPIALIASAAAVVDLGALLARVPRPRVAAALAGALAAALPAVLVTGMIASWPAVRAHAGKRPRTGGGTMVAALEAPALRDALVFVDSMTLPATVLFDPVELRHNRPLVVKDLGDAADAGFARLYPERRPLRMQGTRFVPLEFAPDAPMRHEAGALYPLDDARGGFGDRAPGPAVGGVTLSGGEALRFAIDRPGARFSLPVWALAADAGPMTLDLAIVDHPGSPAIDVTVDGVVVARALATAGPTWAITSHPIAVELTPGRHRIGFRMPTARKGEVLAIDYVELRPRR